MKQKIKNLILMILFGLGTFSLNAQDEGIFESMGLSEMAGYLLIGVGLLMVLIVIVILFKLINMMVKISELQIYEKHGIEAYLEKKEELVNGTSSDSGLVGLYKKWTQVVPITREKDILFDHDYDGIRELDNNLPPWWLYGFYLTIIISVFYIGYYHVLGYGKGSSEEYAYEMEQAAEEVATYLASQPDLIDETNVEVMVDAADIDAGKSIYDANCAVCHLPSGAGLVGPNFTDDYWVHGGDIKSIFSIIKYGVPEKGMISWKAQLNPTEMNQVSSYILTLRGTNPPNQKAPEGVLYIPEGDDSSL